MAWLAVNKNNFEYMFHHKPVIDEYGWLTDKKTYNEVRCYTTSASDFAIRLPNGSIKKLIGRDLKFGDEPVELK